MIMCAMRPPFFLPPSPPPPHEAPACFYVRQLRGQGGCGCCHGADDHMHHADPCLPLAAAAAAVASAAWRAQAAHARQLAGAHAAVQRLQPPAGLAASRRARTACTCSNPMRSTMRSAHQLAGTLGVVQRLQLPGDVHLLQLVVEPLSGMGACKGHAHAQRAGATPCGAGARFEHAQQADAAPCTCQGGIAAAHLCALPHTTTPSPTPLTPTPKPTPSNPPMPPATCGRAMCMQACSLARVVPLCVLHRVLKRRPLAVAQERGLRVCAGAGGGPSCGGHC